MVRLLLIILIGLCAMQWPATADAESRSIAFVQEDGSLRISGRVTWLYGIHIPPTNRTCRTGLRPPRCAPRAVLKLADRVDRMVRCETLQRLRGGGRTAKCWVRDSRDALGPEVDLAAWMLFHGWAVAAPGAPFEYVTLERIARSHGRGIWGFQVDDLTPQ